MTACQPRSRAQAARADDVNHPGPACERHVETESVEQVVVLVWHREDDDDCEEEDSRWRVTALRSRSVRNGNNFLGGDVTGELISHWFRQKRVSFLLQVE